jgi:serine/threonine-protein phosphatase 2A regulatory subunit A
VQQFPVLARQLGEAFFNDKLNPISVAWLQDSIFTIREAAIENFKELSKIFGP